MATSALIAVGVVAGLHLWFLILEMFLWTTPFGQKTFKMSAERANDTAVLAKNQGLYNGFLVAGLVWAMLPSADPAMRSQLATFFLTCVVVAGLYGAMTASRAILFMQAIPAAIALFFVLSTKGA